MIFKCNKSNFEIKNYKNKEKERLRKQFYQLETRQFFAWIPTSLNDGTGKCIFFQRYKLKINLEPENNSYIQYGTLQEEFEHCVKCNCIFSAKRIIKEAFKTATKIPI